LVLRTLRTATHSSRICRGFTKKGKAVCWPSCQFHPSLDCSVDLKEFQRNLSVFGPTVVLLFKRVGTLWKPFLRLLLHHHPSKHGCKKVALPTRAVSIRTAWTMASEYLTMKQAQHAVRSRLSCCFLSDEQNSYSTNQQPSKTACLC